MALVLIAQPRSAQGHILTPNSEILYSDIQFTTFLKQAEKKISVKWGRERKTIPLPDCG